MANPRIVIRELRLEGGNEQVAYPFQAGVNLVLGSVGTGKSSLLELIKYALGGSGVLSGAVREGVSAAVLRVDLQGQPYLFRRDVDGRELEIRSGISGALIERAHIIGTKYERGISEALLEILGLPRLEVPRSRAAPTAETTPVTFFDVLAYVYARQVEIDRSVVNHLDPVREPKRRATFEMLYGLTNERVAAIQRQIGNLRTAIDDARRRNRDVAAFLTAADEPAEDELRLELESLGLQLRDATERLSQLRDGVRGKTTFAEEDRIELAWLEDQLDLVSRDEANAHSEMARLEGVIAQLELDSQRIARSLRAGVALAPIEYVVCPRCLQSIRDREQDVGVCVLCGQADDPTVNDARLEAERARIADQIAESVALHGKSRSDLKQVQSNAAQLQRLSSIVRARIDERTTAFVSPLMDEIETASRDVERLAARRGAVSRSLELWGRHRQGVGELKELQSQLDSARKDLNEAQSELEEGQQRIRLLSDLFDELLRNFNYPWYERARIDPHTYLPVVNEEPFEQASGGMKTLINLAYHLAGLRYAIRHRDSHLPLFLMVDSPRKNLGAENVDDKHIASQIYLRFRNMQDTNPTDFQMIVADNDVPLAAAEFHATKLSYDRPLIPWVRHPGPDEVEPIE